MNMKTKMKKSGITLMEMIAVVAAVAILTLLSMPAIRSLRKSFVSEGAVRSLINSTLASARAMAAKKRCYVGVRFQTAYEYNGDASDLNDPDEFYAHDVLNAKQYMVFIMHKRGESQHLLEGFWVLEGAKPIKLPGNFGVMDMKLGTQNNDTIKLDGDINDPKELQDTTTFAIIFSPSGKLVINEIRCRNKDGWYITSGDSTDEIFNKDEFVEAIEVNGRYVKNRAMFFQDDYPPMGLGQEISRRRFIIYEKDKFKQVYENGSACTDYLEDLWDTKQIYVNPYTGQLICP